MPASRYFLTLRLTLFFETPNVWMIFALSTASLAHQLGGEHSERSPILLAMLKHRMDPTEVGPLFVLLNHTDPIVDLCGSIGDKWEQCLGHSTFLLKVLLFPGGRYLFIFRNPSARSFHSNRRNLWPHKEIRLLTSPRRDP